MATSSLPEDKAPDPSPPPPPLDNAAAASSVDASEETAAEKLRLQVDDLIAKTDQLEQRVNEMAEFYGSKEKANRSKGISGAPKEKEKLMVRSGSSNNMSSLGCGGGGGGGGRKEVYCSKRMQEVMRQFGTILRQLSQHKWAWPFMQPVDVEGLHLDDYYEVIKRPMDFTTIRDQMEANLYKHVREIYADVRLVFTNAMTYNEDKSDVHVMAKTLLEKFRRSGCNYYPKSLKRKQDKKRRRLKPWHKGRRLKRLLRQKWLETRTMS
ncbi:transcription factor GTE1-like [Iris pallida]|uniref:Transcription factor GTE1-like n=1 Tax=Iris pallida TaxID=29817 RepID=A0AAX6G653_IRIPA|nr:transcription factor GTE1-like [Iris pallida]